MSYNHGHFYWNELATRDVESAKKFYADIVGWTFSTMPMDDGQTYWICEQDGKPVGGIFAMIGAEFDNVPEHWLGYIAVTDIDACIAQAKASGGKIVRAAFDVDGVGRIAILSDINGAVTGWITPADCAEH